jgi:flagellin-like protein
MKKMKIFTSKKGISPLVATVILIAFAVALGAVVMNIGASIGGSKISPLLEPKECQTAGIDLVKINDNAQLSFGGSGSEGFIEFTLNNVGQKKIDKVHISVVGEQDTYNADISDTIEIASQIRRRTPYDYNKYGNAKLITWTPMIYKGNELLSCSGGAAKYQAGG